MNTNSVIALLLSLPQTRQSQHVRTPDFRVGGKIFATIPSQKLLALKLTLEQQENITASDPSVFSIASGRWGEMGWTNAEISKLDEATALSSLMVAWTNVISHEVKPTK